MMKFLHELIFGKNPVLSGILALGVVASIALGCNCGKNLADLAESSNTAVNTASNAEPDDETVPSTSEVERLVKATTAEFADGVATGDFSDLYANASQDFRRTYTEDQIKTAFKSYTDKKKVVLPVLKKVPASDAEFSPDPSLRTQSGLQILVAKGKFPTKPYSVRYDYEYVMRDGDWKLLKLVINIPLVYRSDLL